MFSSGV